MRMTEKQKKAQEIRRRVEIAKVVVFEAKIVLADLCNVNKEFRDRINSMTNGQIRKLIWKNKRNWEKELKKGILKNWAEVADRIIKKTSY